VKHSLLYTHNDDGMRLTICVYHSWEMAFYIVLSASFDNMDAKNLLLTSEDCYLWRPNDYESKAVFIARILSVFTFVCVS
jgi:hypothetical protein